MLVVVLVWAQMGVALAQVDPQARALAEQAYPTYQTAVQTGDWAAFNQVFTSDPVMTRKVFLSALQRSYEQFSTDPKASDDWYTYAKVLATLIGARWSDSGPTSILAAIEAERPGDQVGQMMWEYAAPLYSSPASQGPGYVALDPATQKYGEFELLPANWTAAERLASYPLFGVFGRIQLAQGYACLDQGLRQANLATSVIEQHSRYVAEHGNDPAMQATLSFFQTGLDTFRVVTLAELGLLSEATAQLPALLARQENKNYRSAVLLSCARAALQEGKTADAAAFLKDANARLEPRFVPPPLRFALLTADYQVRRQQGYRPGAAEKVKDFQDIWLRGFADYSPFERVQADAYWYFARKATRYWLAEFEPGAPETEKVCDDLHQVLFRWFSGLKDLRKDSQATVDDWIFNPEQFGNYLTALMAITDVWVAVMETYQVDSAPQESFITLFEPLLAQSEVWTEALTEKGQFTVTESGLLCELRGRLDLMKARGPTRTVTERVELANRAVDLVAKSGDPEVTLNVMISAGKTLQKLGRSDLAISRWKEALALAERLSYVEKATQAASLLAAEYSGQKKWQEAAVYADKTSQKIEESVVLVANDAEASRALAHTANRMAEVSVRAAVESDDPEKALAALVRGKDAQSATAQVRGQASARPEVVAVQQQQQEVAALSVQVEKLEALPASKTRDELLSKTQKLLAETKADFLLKVRELRQRYPELYSRVLKFDPLDLPDVQKMLPPEAAVIQYFPTDDALYVFVVTKETFRLRSVPVTESELDQSIASFVRAIRRSSKGDAELEAGSKALYAHLIEPCQADIEGKSILVLIPAGRLNILPFACLSAPGGAPLIDSKLILELAKPTDFMRISQDPPRKVRTVVAFANATGDLPAADKEGDQIAALFPGSKLFKGKDATKKNFFDFGADAEVLHLATHGESNSDNSLTNYLRMTGDEKIAQEEIFALALDNTSIVTLSACNTAIGDNLDSKFVASLAEAFWLGGSQSVIASLWSVNDDSTGLLMTEFYRGLQAGHGKAQALKDAQMKVRRTPGYEHPYFWAGFLLFGDWR
jgi:CHAT domain-containing protein